MDVAVFSLLCTTLLFYLPEYRTHICHMTRKTLGPVSTSDAKPYHTMPCSFRFFHIYTFSFFYLFSFPFFDIIANVFLPILFKTQERIRHICKQQSKRRKKTQEKITLNMINERIDTCVRILFVYLFTCSFFLLFAVIPWMLFTLLRLKDEKKKWEANERLNRKWIASKRINVFNEALECCCCCHCCCSH